MDLLAHLDEPKYPDDVDASEIRNERKEMWGRLYDKYEERSKQCEISVDLDDSVEYYENYPHTEKEFVENPRTKTFRKFIRNYGDLIDELTTVAGEPALDEEELLLSESESEDDCEDFIDIINVEKVVLLDNSSNDEDDSTSKEELLENDGEQSISNYLCRLTCTGCGREVATVLNIEDSAMFKCDNCWLEYDHGCDGDGCRECREIEIWVQTRREVFRRISRGDLDGDGRNQGKSDDPEDARDGDKDDPKGGGFDDVDDSDGAGDDDIDGPEGGEDDDSSQCDTEGLTCVKCGVGTEVPVVMEDSFSFHCDDCLLGYQHGCDINQDCQQCREIVIFVQARGEVTIKLREELREDQMDDLEPLGDVDEDMSMGSTVEESEADQNSQTVPSNLSDEIAVSTTGTITEDENKMDTTDVVSKDASCDLNDTVPVENKASKNKMTASQLEILVPFFAENPGPTSDQKLQLALKTGLTKQVIQRWFDNRRRYEPNRVNQTSNPKVFFATGGTFRLQVANDDDVSEILNQDI